MRKAETCEFDLKCWGTTFDTEPKRPLHKPVLEVVDSILDFKRTIPSSCLENGSSALLSIPEKYRDLTGVETNEENIVQLYHPHENCNIQSYGSEKRHEYNLQQAIDLSKRMQQNDEHPRNEAFFDDVFIYEIFGEWIGSRIRANGSDNQSQTFNTSSDPIHEITNGSQDRFSNNRILRHNYLEYSLTNHSVCESNFILPPLPTAPKPDRWFGFPVQVGQRDAKRKCTPNVRNSLSFDLAELAALEEKGIICCPFGKLSGTEGSHSTKSWKRICFPSVIVEVKKQHTSKHEARYLYSQITNATSLCATLLKLFAGERYAEREMPVVGITFHGTKARVFLTYATGCDLEGSSFHCQCIWAGDLRYLRCAIQFRRILDTTQFWMAHVLRSQISGHLDHWRHKFLSHAESPTQTTNGMAQSTLTNEARGETVTEISFRSGHSLPTGLGGKRNEKHNQGDFRNESRYLLNTGSTPGSQYCDPRKKSIPRNRPRSVSETMIANSKTGNSLQIPTMSQTHEISNLVSRTKKSSLSQRLQKPSVVVADSTMSEDNLSMTAVEENMETMELDPDHLQPLCAGPGSEEDPDVTMQDRRILIPKSRKRSVSSRHRSRSNESSGNSCKSM